MTEAERLEGLEEALLCTTLTPFEREVLEMWRGAETKGAGEGWMASARHVASISEAVARAFAKATRQGLGRR